MDKRDEVWKGTTRYEANEGEQYAEAAARRFGLTTAERRARPPGLDFTVPRNELLYSRGGRGGGVNMQNAALGEDLPTQMALRGESPQRIWEETGLIWNPFSKRWETSMFIGPEDYRKFGPRD
jgi:hypothetical protein